MGKETLEQLHDDDDVIKDDIDNDDTELNDDDDSSNDNNNAGNDGATGDNGDDTNGDNLDADNFTGTELFLSQFGIQGGMIEFEAEGDEPAKSVHFDELKPEEQYNILLDLAQSGATPIEKKYDLDEEEIGLLNLVRKSNKPVNEAINDLVQSKLQEILSNKEIEDIDYTTMSSDTLYTKWLRETNPDASEEEITEELNKEKESKFFESKAERIRTEFINEQEESLRLKQEQLNRENELMLEEDRKAIVTAIENEDSILGFELDTESKNDVLEKVLELGPHGDSLFMEEVFGDPKKLFKAAFLYYKAEEQINAMEEYYKKEITKSYKRGKEDSINGMPSNPLNGNRSLSVSNENGDDKKPLPRSTQKISMNELHSDED